MATTPKHLNVLKVINRRSKSGATRRILLDQLEKIEGERRDGISHILKDLFDRKMIDRKRDKQTGFFRFYPYPIKNKKTKRR